MTDVFISYSRDDAERVEPLVEALSQEGLSVWWDRDIGGGANWRQTLLQRLESAGCVIVIWSLSSTGEGGDFVRDEAGRARDRGVLLPVRVDDVAPPLGFGEIQTLDLLGWRGEARDPYFQDIVTAARTLLVGGSRPKPKAPDSRARRTAVSAGAIATVAAVVGFGVDIGGLQTGICRIPGVRAGCSALRLGGAATTAERELWESRPEGDCEVLREYLRTFPIGAFAEEARSRLEARLENEKVTWIPERRQLLLRLNPEEPFEDEDAAQADALTRASEEAQHTCAFYSPDRFRLLSSAPEVDSWKCRPRRGGVACGFVGKAVCQGEARKSEDLCP